MNVYKINDIINYEFLKIPKSMFLNEDYRKLSSDAKLTYALLYDRLSLSKLNNWINEDYEVYLIYTREEIAEDLGLSYKKAISAFRELLSAGLIREQRCGRGMPNKIYIVKIDLPEKKANLSLVPTPSVPETKIGSFMPARSGTKRPPKPPMSEAAPGIIVLAMCFFMSSTAR